MSNYYKTLAENRDEKRAQALEQRQFHGMTLPNFMFENPENRMKKYDFAVHQATAVAMSLIVLAVKKVGWEKFLEGMEKWQWPSTEARCKALAERYGYEESCNGHASLLDTKLHTLTWSRGCGWVKGSSLLTEFDENFIDASSTQCPQIERLREMNLLDDIDNLGIWCDAYDQCILNGMQKGIVYTHCYCLQHDPICMQRLEYLPEGETFLHGPINGNKREDCKESFYEMVKRTKKEMRQKVAMKDHPELPTYIVAPWLDDCSEEEVAKRGCETKWHIVTDTLLVAGLTVGWEELINYAKEKQEYGLNRMAEERRFHYGIAGHTVKDAAAAVSIGYAGLPYEHQIVKYRNDQVVGVAKRCPIVDAAKEMNLEESQIADLSLWCDYYKGVEVHNINPEINITHTHCLARGDEYCRFVIE